MDGSSFFFSHRRMRLPSWRVVLPAVLVVAGLLAVFFLQIHAFLARSVSSGGSVAVVEGWVNDAAIEHAAAAYRAGSYTEIYVSGVPVNRGKHLLGTGSSDVLVIRSLVSLGVDPGHITSASIGEELRGNRTLRMAYRVKQALPTPPPASFDLITNGVHAFRSQLTYQRVIPDSKVGVVSVPSDDYDPAAWWASSAGFKQVLMEFIAVAYQFVRGFDQPKNSG